MFDKESIIFLYAVISHGSLALAYAPYLTKMVRKKTIYFLGHIFITTAMIIRILPQYRGSIQSTISGITGHGCLLLFFVLTTLLYTSREYLVIFGKDTGKYWLNIMCIIGQIGMISVYYIEYIKINDKELYNKYTDYYTYIYIIIFSLLAYFYYNIAYRKENIKHTLFYPLVMVSILYSIFLYKSLHKHILGKIEYKL